MGTKIFLLLFLFCSCVLFFISWYMFYFYLLPFTSSHLSFCHNHYNIWTKLLKRSILLVITFFIVWTQMYIQLYFTTNYCIIWNRRCLGKLISMTWNHSFNGGKSKWYDTVKGNPLIKIDCNYFLVFWLSTSL